MTWPWSEAIVELDKIIEEHEKKLRAAKLIRSILEAMPPIQVSK